MKNGVITKKYCPRCRKFREIEYFGLHSNGIRYWGECEDCRIKRRGLYQHDKRWNRQIIRDKDGIKMYRCSGCREFKYEMDYWKDKVNGIRSRCRECIKKTWTPEYYKTREKRSNNV